MSRLSIYKSNQLIHERTLGAERVTMGRNLENDIVLNDLTLSRFHARIESRGDSFFLVALPNQNGVFINGSKVLGEQKLRAGDRVRLGIYVAIFDAQGQGMRREATAGQPVADDSHDGPATFSVSTDLLSDSTGIDTAVPEAAVLVLTYNGIEVSRFSVTDEMTIGRSKSCDVVISLLGLSRKHAVIFLRDDAVMVRDLGSQNGTWINNVRMETSETVLAHGDVLNFYEYCLIFMRGTEDVAAEFDLGMPALEAKTAERMAVQVEDPSLMSSTHRSLELGDGSFFEDSFEEDAAEEIGTDLIRAAEDFDAADDDEGTFEGVTYNARPPEMSGLARTALWPSEEVLRDALVACEQEAAVGLEIYLDDELYTQFSLVQEITKVGSDPRCDLALPYESGLLAWHCTLVHMGACTMLYRASAAGALSVEDEEVDAARLTAGSVISMGRIRVVYQVRG